MENVENQSVEIKKYRKGKCRMEKTIFLLRYWHPSNPSAPSTSPSPSPSFLAFDILLFDVFRQSQGGCPAETYCCVAFVSRFRWE